MAKRFTHGARQALLSAIEQARLRCQAVEPEHLLLAVAEAAEPVTTRALVELGVRADAIAAHLRKPVEEPLKKNPPFSPATKRVLDASVQKAKDLSHSSVRTEHLLLALADEDTGGQAVSILKALGVDLASLRHLLTENCQPDPQRAGTQMGWLSRVLPRAGANRDWVVSVRLDQPTLTAVDGLVRAGLAKSRSEAVFLLCRRGIEAHQELFGRLAEKMASVAEIEREMRRIFSEEAKSRSMGL